MEAGEEVEGGRKEGRGRRWREGGRKEGGKEGTPFLLSFNQCGVVQCSAVQCSATELVSPAAHTLRVGRKWWGF